MILVTGSNERYALRMNPYLASLQEFATFPVYQVGVGFTPDKLYSKVAPVCLTHEQNAGSPPETECIQHGSFLSVIPDKGTTDTIMYTDGDFTMQRALTEDDWQYLRLEHGQVSIGYNGGADETLLTEYHRLGPKVSGLQMETLWGGDWHTLPIYNVGCIAATRGTWEYIHRTYMKSWHIVGDCFQPVWGHHWPRTVAQRRCSSHLLYEVTCPMRSREGIIGRIGSMHAPTMISIRPLATKSPSRSTYSGCRSSSHSINEPLVCSAIRSFASYRSNTSRNGR